MNNPVVSIVSKMVIVALTCLVVLPGFFAARASTAKFSDVTEAVAYDLDPSYYPLQTPSGLEKYLGLSSDQYISAAFYRSDDAMKAEEMLIVEFEPGQQEAVVDAVNARIQSQEDIYSGYAPTQYKQVQNVVLKVYPNYLFYVIGDASDVLTERFEGVI